MFNCLLINILFTLIDTLADDVKQCIDNVLFTHIDTLEDDV